MGSRVASAAEIQRPPRSVRGDGDEMVHSLVKSTHNHVSSLVPLDVTPPITHGPPVDLDPGSLDWTVRLANARAPTVTRAVTAYDHGCYSQSLRAIEDVPQLLREAAIWLAATRGPPVAPPAADMTGPLPYVVVLAGGDGTRLGPLTRALYGVELPKQFAVLAGQQSLLQATIDRALMLTRADRISVVVSAHHEARARTQLRAHPEIDVIVQPKNLDTGPGLLLPLIRILERDLLARVIFLPSDHYIPTPAPLIAALRAISVRRIALVGVTPTGPEVEYGWIVRGRRVGRTDAFEVDRFEEKPPHEVADQLWRRGGLWNTFISTAPVAEYWALARRHLPAHAAAFERYAGAIGHFDEARALAAIYEHMTAANFSRDLLAHAADLAVVPVSGTGWSDWGSPARVFASLAGTPGHDALVARIRDEAEPAAMAG